MHIVESMRSRSWENAWGIDLASIQVLRDNVIASDSDITSACLTCEVVWIDWSMGTKGRSVRGVVFNACAVKKEKVSHGLANPLQAVPGELLGAESTRK